MTLDDMGKMCIFMRLNECYTSISLIIHTLNMISTVAKDNYDGISLGFISFIETLI